jgi:hypothetical protein
MWLSGPFLACCLLLAWGGVAKIVRPDETRIAARALGMPSSRVAVRVFGATEFAAAIVGAATGRVGALIIAVAFAALAAIAGRLLARAPDAPCGCLGASGAPVSWAHVVVNASAAAIALGAAAGGSPFAVFLMTPLAGMPFAILVACAARLAWLLLAARPTGIGGR